MCQIPGKMFTRTMACEDINYSVASTEDQSAIFNSWSAFLNYFDASIPFQTHLYQPPQSLRRAVQDQHPPVHDNFDSIRASPLER